MEWLIGVVASVLGGAIGWWAYRRSAYPRQHTRLRAEGKVLATLRVTSGRVPGMSSQWMSGGWTVADGGRLTFWSVTVHVRGIADAVRRPTAGELWSVDPDMVIATIDTGTGTVEMGVTADDLDWVREKLRRS
ncbi:MAG: hypothetical protein FWF90_13450 [Promicromonosporaceae bacterium]|nr:hypothetical protein [Promicromonosporaceae bacterium]